jgi:eukaryotic-like serine/threonine-protein kinase
MLQRIPMSLSAGTRLGPYEIVGAVGAGGMGDVYRARDTRLDRTVAIKVVRTDFSERFEREARSISALNHPNICTLHDVGEQSGTAYLVMEFVEGAPIAGPLPIADVIRSGIQICDALDAAHRKSIVHRDLKPANILATKSGIKLLDFGLAKLQSNVAAAAAGTDATVAALTGAHTIVGTPQYMSPEQIEGREADARSDIFALGCVLYELITGRRAFEGKTTSNVMAAVLATEPRRISELVPVTPPTLEWVVLRCLEKDPDARWQSARDVALQLRWVAEHPVQPAGVAASSSRPALLAGLALGILLTGIAGTTWVWRRPATPGQSSGGQASLAVQLPAGVSLAAGESRPNVALSPDGRAIAFVGGTPDGYSIYLRRLDQFDAVKIAGTEGGAGPFFSPTGEWLAFVIDGKIKKVPVSGGAAIPVTHAPSLRGAVWLSDDTIVFSPGATGGLMRVPAQGGTPTTLTTLDAAKREKTHRSLVALPGGKAVMFVIGSDEIDTYDDARIVALTLETGKVTELVKGGYAPLFSPTGHLLYVRNATVFAVPFDPVTLKAGATPVQVLKDVATLPNYGTAEFDVSANGTLIFASGGNLTERDMVRWLDRRGNFQPIGADEKHYVLLDLSPDNRRLLFCVGGANNVLWTYDLERNQHTRLTYRFDAEAATWSHDGSHVTYWSGMDLRSIAADGSGAEEVLIPASDLGGRTLRPGTWSADGQKLALTIYTPEKGDDVGVYLRADKRLVLLADTRFNEADSRLSPDGLWIAYVSDESEREEVYVRATDGSGARYAVSSGGGSIVRWSQQGRELVFGAPAGLMTASFAPGKPPRIGVPTMLIPGKDRLGGGIDFVPTADGQRFATLFRRPSPSLTEIRVVLNWAEGLIRR